MCSNSSPSRSSGASKLYLSRVSPEVQKQKNFYNQAIVDILIKQYGNTESDIW